MSSATLAHHAEPERGILVRFRCSANVSVRLDDGFVTEAYALHRHYGMTLPAAEALVRWGAETTLADLESRARCHDLRLPVPEGPCSIHVPTSPVFDAART